MSSIFTMDSFDLGRARMRCAVDFIEAHLAEHLDTDHLVHRCAAHLLVHHSVNLPLANEIAVHALAEVQAKTVPAVICAADQQVVRVLDPDTTKVVVFTASELLELAKARRGTDEAVQACGRRAALH